MEAEKTYITAEELATKLHYHPRYIREQLLDKVLTEGVHYFRPFGRRRILFIWEAIEQDMMKPGEEHLEMIPMASGGVCHG